MQTTKCWVAAELLHVIAGACVDFDVAEAFEVVRWLE